MAGGQSWLYMFAATPSAVPRVAVLWAIAYNLTRAAGVLAGRFHARATTTTIRAHLITVPARVARSARRITLHLPQHWPWQPAWPTLHATIHPAPRAAA